VTSQVTMTVYAAVVIRLTKI